MFRLKLPTDNRWAEMARQNINDILIDHAFCEQKAASTAISFIVQFPEYTELAESMAELAQEEMEHFKMVLTLLKERNITLGKERKDEYVNQLRQFVIKGGSRQDRLTDLLLLAALIEARSCERFKILSEKIKDASLAEFYARLVKSEAQHYTLFLKFARKYGKSIDYVNQRWEDFLTYEAKIIANLNNNGQLVHG